MSAYTAFKAANSARATKTVSRASKGARNNIELSAFVVSMYMPPAGDANDKARLTLQFGSLANVPGAVWDAAANAHRVSIPTALSKNMAASGVDVNALDKHHVLTDFKTLELRFSRAEITECGGIEAGDFVYLRGITFSWWFSAKAGKPLEICNVDFIKVVPRAHRAALAYAIWFEARMPVHKMVPETELELSGAIPPRNDTGAAGGASDSEVQRLGTRYYTLPSFGSDTEAFESYAARLTGDVYEFDYKERNDPENPQIAIVTSRPQIYAAANTYTAANGFKTIAQGSYWTGSTLAEALATENIYATQAFLTLRPPEVACLGVASETEWPVHFRALLESSKFFVLARENVTNTEKQDLNQKKRLGFDIDEGVDVKMMMSTAAFVMDVAGEIERTAIEVPTDRIARVVAGGDSNGALRSALHDVAYHSRPHRDEVVSLNEWTGDLAKLAVDGRHRFYAVSRVYADNERARKIFYQEPANKQYLFFDPDFGVDASELADDALAQKYGISERSSLIPNARIGAACPAYFYAVLKPEHRFAGLADTALFATAVRLCVRDADAFLARIRTAATPAVSVTAPSTPLTADERSPVGALIAGAKRRAEDELSNSESESVAGGRSKRARTTDSPRRSASAAGRRK